MPLFWLVNVQFILGLATFRIQTITSLLLLLRSLKFSILFSYAEENRELGMRYSQADRAISEEMLKYTQEKISINHDFTCN